MTMAQPGLVAVAALLAAALGAHAQEQRRGFENALGSLENVTLSQRGRIVITPAGSAAVEARIGELLYSGDLVEAVSGAEATIVLFGRPAISINPSRPRYRVSEPDPGVVPESVAGPLRRVFGVLFASPKPPIPIVAAPRGAPVGQRAVLAASRLLPEGVQNWTGAARQVALVWEGYAHFAEISSRDCHASCRQDVRNLLSARFELEPPPRLEPDDTVHVTAPGGHRVVWRVIAAAKAPQPDWLLGRAPRNETEQLLWSLWLLQNAGPHWRLEAISRIAELSQKSFAADRVWHAVRAREIAFD